MKRKKIKGIKGGTITPPDIAVLDPIAPIVQDIRAHRLSKGGKKEEYIIVFDPEFPEDYPRIQLKVWVLAESLSQAKELARQVVRDFADFGGVEEKIIDTDGRDITHKALPVTKGTK